MNSNSLKFLIVFYILSGCSQNNTSQDYENESKQNPETPINAPIKVYNEIKLNENISSIFGKGWEKSRKNPLLEDNIDFYINENLEDDLADFYNIRFDFIKIQTINDSIAEVTLIARTGEDPKNRYENNLNKFTIKQVLDIYIDKYGKPHLSNSVKENSEYKNFWDFPNIEIEFISKDYEISYFLPDSKFKDKFDSFVKEFYANSDGSLRYKARYSLELGNQISSGKIQGTYKTYIHYILEISIKSKYFKEFMKVHRDKAKIKELKSDSLKRAEAKEKI